MKLAFSTLGCPGWTFDEIFAAAKDLKMDGIEVRGLGNEMYAPRIGIFSDSQIEGTMKRMQEANLCFSQVSSAADLSAADADKTLKEAKEYIDLACRIGSGTVRILPENSTAPTGEKDVGAAAELFAEMCDYGAKVGINPVVETAGYLADSDVMLKFLKKVNRGNAFALWDIHHPYRYFGESPVKTASNLEGLIKYVHVKDSKVVDEKNEYRMMGYGDIPILECLKELSKRSYDGFVSLEWVKRWSPDLQEPGIVFAHFAGYMQYLMTQL